MIGDKGGHRRSHTGVVVWLVTILVFAQVVAGCTAIKSLGRAIGREEGAINTLIHGAAVAGVHSEAAIKSATERAVAVIDAAVSPLLKAESQEARAARSVFTSVVCDSIATAVQTGKWPSATQAQASLFNSVLGEFRSDYGSRELAKSAASVAQSIWTGSDTDQEAVRNVVCAAVGVKV